MPLQTMVLLQKGVKEFGQKMKICKKIGAIAGNIV